MFMKKNRMKINKNYSFENFYTSGEYDYVLNVLITSLSKYNRTDYPLVISGGICTGKTHLLCACAAHYKKAKPKENILITNFRDILDNFISSISMSTLNRFTNKMLSYDAVFIDDIQYLSKKFETQNELMYIFENLMLNNRRVIISSLEPLIEENGYSEKLVSCFSQGLLLKLPYPNTESKKVSIKKYFSNSSVFLDESVVSFLAERNNDFRLLQGSLNKVLGYVKMHDKESRQITIEELENII